MGFLGFGKNKRSAAPSDKDSSASQPMFDELRSLRVDFEAIDWPVGGVWEDDRHSFILLLSGLSSCRISPGIPENMGHEKLYRCKDEDDISALREHMEKLFGIIDEASLWNALNSCYRSFNEYDTFRTFWAGRPEFDISSLNKKERMVFETSIRFAEKLRDIVGNNGFLAWDINERIGMCRRAYAAGYITEERFWEVADSMAYRASAYYDNWGEYALSCMCGAAYYAFRQLCDNDESETATSPFIGIQLNLVRALTEKEGIWRTNAWPKYGQRKKDYALAAKDMISMIPGWDGGQSCIATDRITVDGTKVGYMYREEPDNEGDSGWRFLAGDEDEAYMDNAENSGIYGLNTICNHDPDIIDFLYAKNGSRFQRIKGGPLKPA